MKSSFMVEASDRGVRAVRLAKAKRRRRFDSPPESRRWRGIAEREIDNYFAGKLRSFSALCDLDGLPPFTRAVLKVTAQIPYGDVRSYRWIAEKLGKPGASRAVGNALAKNPVPIIIPCHRVVRSDGTIGGFALGTGWKRRLLELERKS
jgi:methylated-DNA-[protein]-cysteine S-methyltransferase